ncbi:MAG: 2'-5' RNA ligase family protein, partial [Tissierellia bacterium]|nr:2'-5' RNA ligase family protein [Tissierellia bacterium]
RIIININSERIYMKYFIGVPIPISYKNKIEMLRAEFRFFTTEPHITLVPPPALPDEDDFIEKVVEVCKTIEPFDIRLDALDRFGNRVLYVSVDSPGLIDLQKKIYEILGLQQERRGFTPHLTIVKQRPKRPVDIAAIRKRAEIKLIPSPEYTLNSITVYHQPKEHSIYIPYMEIPLGE